MGSVNKVILVGNLGRDAEVRYTPGGAPVASFSIATTENWTSKDGEKHEQTEWHRIVLWGKSAESLQPYLTKGKQIYVEGRLQTRQWEKDGQKHYTTETKAAGAAAATARPIVATPSTAILWAARNNPSRRSRTTTFRSDAWEWGLGTGDWGSDLRSLVPNPQPPNPYVVRP